MRMRGRWRGLEGGEAYMGDVFNAVVYGRGGQRGGVGVAPGRVAPGQPGPLGVAHLAHFPPHYPYSPSHYPLTPPPPQQPFHPNHP
jgi:hypothetical protein